MLSTSLSPKERIIVKIACYIDIVPLLLLIVIYVYSTSLLSSLHFLQTLRGPVKSETDGLRVQTTNTQLPVYLLFCTLLLKRKQIMDNHTRIRHVRWQLDKRPHENRWHWRQSVQIRFLTGICWLSTTLSIDTRPLHFHHQLWRTSQKLGMVIATSICTGGSEALKGINVQLSLKGRKFGHFKVSGHELLGENVGVVDAKGSAVW